MSSLFKKRTTGKYAPTVQTKTMSSKELSDLIERLQKNADTLEGNIVDTDNQLQKDVENIKQSKPVQYKEPTLSKIAESEKLVGVLETDAVGAQRMNHPQGDMITEDIRQLKGRIANLRIKHQQVYSLTPGIMSAPQMNWDKLIEEKQGVLSSKGFANDLPSVDRQVEEHSLFQKEVEAIGEHINKDDNADYISGLQVKYNKLLSASQQRQNDLGSLQDYMQRCTNELYWLDQQEKDRMQYDWSDRNLDYPSRRRQYENYINRSLEAKEEGVNQLHIEGEKLIASGHPGNNPIAAHMEAVHADWKEYLNLLICEESHLKYMEDYHQFHKDAKDAQDLLKKVDMDLDQKYNPDFKDKYQIESLQNELHEQEKALDKYDEVVKSLQKRSHQVLPLKYRRETPLKTIPVEALCDFDCDEGQISRGQRYTLKANKGEKWEVADGTGKKFNAPGVCFMTPPTDSESIALADSVASQHRALKQKTAGSRNALARRYEDLKKDQSGVDAQDTQGRQLLSKLDKVCGDLDKQDKAIAAQLRPPLEQSRPVEDSAERLKALKNITNEVRRIEPEMNQQVQESQAYLSAVPNSSSAPMLRSKLQDVNKKYDRVNQLLGSAQEKVEGANRLESSLKEGKDMLATYENRLAQENTVPEDLRSIEKQQQELATISSELKSKKGVLTQAEQNLQKSKRNCTELATRFQEHCPDIDREESEVGKLNQRYDNLNQQIQNRSQSLEKAKTSYSSYRNGYDDLDNWLNNIPNNEPRETDSVMQVDAKLKQQRLLLGEISAREQDLKKVSGNAQQYQQAVKDYEYETEKLRSILDLENRWNGLSPKRAKIQSPAAKVKEEETVLAGKFTEVNAVNKQRMQNLEFAQSLLRQQPQEEIMLSSAQMNRSERPAEETWKIQKMLEDEIQRRNQLENEIKTTQNEILLLQNQKPQETVVKKELVKKVPDPQLEDEYYKIQEKVSEEQRKNKSLQGELEALKLKIRSMEYEQKEGGQEYVVKEVLRIEQDKSQQDEYLQLKEDLEELKRQKAARENELVLLRQRITLLSDEKNREQEKITEKEVVKLQNDPQLAAEFKMLQENMKRESELRQKQEEELRLLQEKLKRLEKERAMAEGKITVKEVLKVEKDQASEREVMDLRRQYEEETSKVRTTLREKNELIRKIQILEEENAKVVVQEKVREIVRPDPKAESELANLRLELLEQERKYRSSEDQVNTLKVELTSLTNRGTQVEVKEIIKEVITHKTDPEVQKELEKLREEIVDKTRVCERADLEIAQLKQEIQSWKDTKPQVQVKELVQEVLQYREDPKTKQEVESLKAALAEEQKKRLELEKERMSQEDKIRQKERELSQVKEKVVQQEVVKLEEDPALKAEVNSFSRNIENELKQVDILQEELRKLQRRKSELERQLEELERERQARREAELEIQRLRIRLNELEQKEMDTKEKVTLQQKVVLQQDPQQEKEHNLLKLQVEEEKHKRQMLENELDALRKKVLSLEKTEVREKVVFTDKVEVERDAETEQEIQRLKVSLEEEGRRKRELDGDLDKLKAQLSETEFNNSKLNKELELLREETNKLQAERQSLQLEIRHLQSEIEISVIEARDLRNMTQIDRGVDLDSRLQSLVNELEGLKKISRDKDGMIEELQKRLEAMAVKKEQRENHLRRSIVVIDPDTGREMSPEEAYRFGLIDRNLFQDLQSQVCDWEEITIKGPNGESSVIHDRQSGKQFNIDDALKSGRITRRQYESYINKEMPIQEFALLVSGKK